MHEGREETQWAWKRLQIHGAYNEEDARNMAEGVPDAVVVKRTVLYGPWAPADDVNPPQSN